MIRRDTRRRLDQFIANPACRANVLSAVHDIPMAQVAGKLGLDPQVGQSPFAIGRGCTFRCVEQLFSPARVVQEIIVINRSVV
jgi:hypothetical protein